MSIGAWALWEPRQAAAERFDPNLPVQLTVGPPPGAAPMARVDQARTGRVEELPDQPKQLWHRRVRGGMTLPIAVDASGAIIVAAAVAELVQVGADGAEQWHRRLGMSVASTQPVILSDGTRVVLTALGQVWAFRPNGDTKFQTDLGVVGTDPRTSPLPRDDGSFVVAVGNEIVALDGQGSIVSQADVGERVVGSIAGDESAVYLSTESGGVYRWASPVPPRKIGTYRGIVREGFARTTDGSLVAVVDMDRLVRMDGQSGATTTLATTFGLEGPPTLGEKLVYITTTTGLLMTISAAGEERRVKLAPAAVEDPDAADGGVVTPMYAPASPAVIVDKAGRVAFARTDGRVGVVSVDGQVRYAEKRSCGTPIAVVPAGRRKFVVACRTGDLRLFGP